MARFKMKLPDLPERNHLVWKGGSVLAEIMQVGGGDRAVRSSEGCAHMYADLSEGAIPPALAHSLRPPLRPPSFNPCHLSPQDQPDFWITRQDYEECPARAMQKLSLA